MSDLVKSNHAVKASKLCSMNDNFWNTDVFNNAKEPNHQVNIRNMSDKYKLQIAAPGFKKGDFTISTDDGRITITAESSKQENSQEDNYTRKEFSSSSFTGSFAVPDDVSSEHISARYRKGMLTIDFKKPGGVSSGEKKLKIS